MWPCGRVVLCLLAAGRAAGLSCFMFGPIHCLIVVFSGSCLASRSPYWRRGSCLLCNIWSVACMVSVFVGLLFLLVSLVGYAWTFSIQSNFYGLTFVMLNKVRCHAHF